MTETPVPPVPAPPAGGPPAVPAPPPPVAEADPPGAEHLGDAGKKALDEMKAKWKAAEALAKQSSEELAAERAKAAGKEAEHAAQVAAQKVKDEALDAANARILKAEVRAAAAGKLADPADALQFLDLTKLEVGEDGEVDSKGVAAAIDELVKNKPYLAAQGKQRFQGTGDGGPRNEAVTNVADQITAARKAGNHALAIALEQKRSADLAASK